MNILITGVSSGIGRELSKKMILDGYTVLGLARRINLLKNLYDEINLPRFMYKQMDLESLDNWDKLISFFKRSSFRPDVVVFNAGIYNNDLKEGIDYSAFEKMIKVNFLSVIKGVEVMMKKYNHNIHFIAISSTSAFKGLSKEGVGYAASKLALSVAFESLYQKYHGSEVKFTTVFLGPVKTNMHRFSKDTPFMLTEKQAADCIRRAIKEQKPFYYHPNVIFWILKILRILPTPIFLNIYSKIQKLYV